MVIPQRIAGKAGDIVDGKYTIQKALGEGSFGCVYKVTDISGKTMALKLLRLWDVEPSIRQALMDRFEMEFKTGQIPCLNLVQSTDYGYINGNPFIVMEFCPKGDLSSMIGRTNANFSTIAINILDGLNALHRNGKVHRDLKPENVLFKEDGTAALTDFGISGDRNRRMTERNIFGRPNQLFGTYAYMPPEQIKRMRGDSTVLPTTDIFSFGVLMFQLITGDLPFGRLNSHDDLVTYQKKLIQGLWNRPLLLASKDGEKWEALISRCLVPDYRQRLQTVEEAKRLVPDKIPAYGVIPAKDNISPVEPVGNDTTSDWKLLITQGEEFGKTFNLSELVANSPKWLLSAGRDYTNDLILKDFGESYISRKHFTIESDGGSLWVIRDGQWDPDEGKWYNSSNGTYVNSTRVSDDGYVLKKNDIINVGNVSLKII